MALQVNKLSALSISRARISGYYFAGAGLVLQVSRSGSRSWLFRYVVAGQRHEMCLGSLQTVDLASARKRARECRAALLDGQGPLEVRRAARTTHALTQAKLMTFDQCAAASRPTAAAGRTPSTRPNGRPR